MNERKEKKKKESNPLTFLIATGFLFGLGFQIASWVIDGFFNWLGWPLG